MKKLILMTRHQKISQNCKYLSKHPRLNNLRQQKSMDKVKENPKLNEKSVEKEKWLRKLGVCKIVRALYLRLQSSRPSIYVKQQPQKAKGQLLKL